MERPGKAILAAAFAVPIAATALIVGRNEIKLPDHSKDGENCRIEAEKNNNFGNGVYYFPCVDAYPKAISRFLEQHPDKEIVSAVAKDAGLYGRTIGYTVITRPKK